MKRLTTVCAVAAVFGLLFGMAATASAQHPFPIQLKGYAADGSVVAISPTENSTVPYSPKQTCGTCHDYTEITKGFHFQQGWDVISDDYGETHGMPPFVSSPGMAGKW
jgi:hypothetical protein